jgi:MFS family permease
MQAAARPATGGSFLSRISRALRYRNYRLFFAGQGISLVGTWLQQVALSWLVYRLTNSALLLGVVGFAGQIPSFLLAPFAGVIVDHWDRRRLLMLTQTLAMLQAGILALLVLTGRIEVWHIILLGALLGMVNAFDMPARQAFVVEMIEDRADLPNAIALNSSMVNGARLVGPAVAGALLASVGEGWCFLLNSISYIAVIAAFAVMKVTPRAERPQAPNVLSGLKEGAAYAFGSVPIRALLLLMAVISLVGMPYVILMPVYASRILHGNATTLGFLMTASGLGALTGALYLASRRSILGLGRVIVLGVVLFGTGLMALALSRVLWLSLLLMLVTGAGMMVQMASSNTILQTIVDERMRGRVMSLYAMAFMGMAPFGSLLAGWLSSRIGVSNTLLIGGACAVLAGEGLWEQTAPAARAGPPDLRVARDRSGAGDRRADSDRADPGAGRDLRTVGVGVLRCWGVLDGTRRYRSPSASSPAPVPPMSVTGFVMEVVGEIGSVTNEHSL